jgi:hypothetical protein
MRTSENLIQVKLNPCYTQTCGGLFGYHFASHPFTQLDVDGCLIVLMGTFWTCQRCARDLCNRCHGATVTTLGSCQSNDVEEHDFVQATHFVEGELISEISMVKTITSAHHASNHGEIALSIRHGFPCQLSCKIKESLSPSFFIHRYKGVPCDLITSDGQLDTTTVDQFFMDYDKSKSGKKLKV